MNPQGAVHGDAVYTQEALDRIITTLMENNPQSNAAPPASQAAIDRLEKKQLDDKMIGTDGKAECTICIDELHKGDEVSVLPCTHWFHGECVVLWLKEHNTCPICRAPIESRGEQNSGPEGSRQPGVSQRPPTPPAPQVRPFLFPGPNIRMGETRTRLDRISRSPRENEERLNAIRNLGGGYQTPDASTSTSTSTSTSATQARRNSMSPPNPRSYSDNPSRASWVRRPSLSRDRDQGGAQTEQGSYFSSGRQNSRDSRSSQQSGQSGQSSGGGHGPLSWLRDHLTRGSGDRRR